MSTLAERLAEVMRVRELNRTALAKAARVTQAAVTHWLNGTTPAIDGSKALNLEVATGFRAQWISAGRGERLVAPSAQDDMLQPREIELVNAYRQLSEEEQAELLTKVAAAAERNKRLVTRALEAAGVDPAVLNQHKRRPG
jgi:predicted transcriptional regulator